MGARLRIGNVAGLGVVVAALLLLHGGLGRAGAQVTPTQTPPPPPTAPSPPPPDQVSQPTPTFRTGTSIVRVDVSVWGKADAAIADLTADDFVVQEDDVPQRIETFQFVKLDGQRPAGDEDSLEIRSPEHGEAEAAREDVRLFAVFLDEYHVDKEPNIALPLCEALIDFVNRLGPSDLVTVMDQLTPLSSLRFTRDRQALLERMKKFEGRQGEYLRTRSVMEEAQLQSRNVRYVRAEVSLSALEALVTHLGGLRDGRKSVLFVSQGPPAFFGGREQDLHQRIQNILNAANRGNVTINVLDPRGLGTQGRGGSRDTLFILADETGGRRVVNTNDLVAGVRRVVTDASAYYLLGYAPSREFADGKFHKIEVKVKRPGARLLARKGYWAPKAAELTAAAEASARPAVPGVTEALGDLAISKGGESVDVWVGFSRGESATGVSVSWDPRRSGAGSEVLELEIEALDAQSAPVGELRRLHATRTSEPAGTNGDAATRDSPTSAARSGPLVSRFELPPGGMTLRFTARDGEGDAVDRWTKKVIVPEFDSGVALASLRFLRALTALEYRALRSADAPAPTSLRQFRRTDRVLVETECYAPDGAGVEVTAQLLNQSGQQLTTSHQRSTNGRAYASSCHSPTSPPRPTFCECGPERGRPSPSSWRPSNWCPDCRPRAPGTGLPGLRVSSWSGNPPPALPSPARRPEAQTRRRRSAASGSSAPWSSPDRGA